MNKFADWVKKKGIKQKHIASKINISAASLHEILTADHMPNMRVAYEIEKFTNGDVTLYDWIDQNIVDNVMETINKETRIKKKVK